MTIPADEGVLSRFFAEIERARSEIEQDVPGWRLYRPPISEIDDALAFVIAKSKPGERLPFVPPARAQTVVAVKAGSVEVRTAAGAIVAGDFYILQPGEDHSIRPLEDETVIIAMFFRTEAPGVTDGRTVDSR